VLSSTTSNVRLVGRFGPRPVMAAGMAICAGALIWLAHLTETSGYTSQQVGGAIGAAALSTIFATTVRSDAHPYPLRIAIVHGYTTAFCIGASRISRPSRPPITSGLPRRYSKRRRIALKQIGEKTMPELSVLNSTMHYQDSGTGTPLVFLHGNPASSHIWRNVIPHVGHGRLLAPDLIGMGASGKPDIGYSFADHARYLDAWFDALDLQDVILIGHDWGGGLAFDWAARHPQRVAGIAFAEAIVKSFEWEDLSPGVRERSEAVRGPLGEQIVLEKNNFLTAAFSGGVLTPVGAEDLEVYMAPYPTPESRRPILEWVRQRPLGGEPAEVVERVDAFDTWLSLSLDVPKLLMTFEGHGVLIDRHATEWCRENIAALTIVECGQAGHHAPEDRPNEIAAAINTWIDHHQLRLAHERP